MIDMLIKWIEQILNVMMYSPVMLIIAGVFILFVVITTIPKILAELRKIGIKNERKSRMDLAQLSCPIEYRNKDLIWRHNKLNFSRNLGGVIGYGSLTLEEEKTPYAIFLIRNNPVGGILGFLVGNFIETRRPIAIKESNIVYDDKAIYIYGNRIEPQICGYDFVLDDNDSITTLTTQINSQQILKTTTEMTTVLDRIIEAALNVNPALQATLEYHANTAPSVDNGVPQDVKR